MTFEELLNRQKQSVEEIGNKTAALVEKENPYGGGKEDTRFWKPTVDKAGNGSALIRFLPAPDSKIDWVKFYSHGFKGDSGRWFIENCLTTLRQDCPVCSANSQLWNSGLESDKTIARARKRRLHYVSNILVIKDPANPENDNKVFLYKFGPKIFEKIAEKLSPTFEEDSSIDPFNLFTGINFSLRIKKVGDYWNYDSSKFSDAQTSIYGGAENALKELYSSLHPILEFVDPKNYKSYSELKTQFDRVMSGIPETPNLYRSEEAPTKKTDSSSVKMDDETEDDDMAYFRKLAFDNNL